MKEMLKINSNDKKKDDISKIRDLCEKNGTDVYILGSGVYGHIIAQYLNESGIDKDIVFVTDDEYITEEQIQNGVILLSKYIKEYAGTAPLVFGFYDYEVIKNKRRTYEDVITNMFDLHFAVVNNERIDWNYGFFKENEDKFKATYEILSDDRSKAVMQAYLSAAIEGEFDNLYTNYVEKIPYFTGKLAERKIDKLFDCGAYDGDSAHDFIAAFPEYKKVFEFEPDRQNIAKINKRVENEKIRDLTIIDKGVWSETKTLYFRSEGKSSSAVSESGDIAIDVIRLDDMYEEFSKASLIKMDIEGSELKALEGAKKVIQEISPALAICVYHKVEDLITIPQFISSLVEEGTYEYFLGYQGTDLAELVFYALPAVDRSERV